MDILYAGWDCKALPHSLSLSSLQSPLLRSPQRDLELLGLSMPVYLNLHAPALAWQMHQLGWGASLEVFQNIIGQYRAHCGNSMVLKAIIDAFAPEHWVPHLADMVSIKRSL